MSLKDKRDMVKFVRDLMMHGNPLRQLFVMDAITKLADAVSKSKPEDYEGQNYLTVHPEAWITIAREIKRETDEYLKPTIKFK